MTQDDKIFLQVLKEHLDNACDNTLPQICARLQSDEGRASIESMAYEMAGEAENGTTIDTILARVEDMLDEN